MQVNEGEWHAGKGFPCRKVACLSSVLCFWYQQICAFKGEIYNDKSYTTQENMSKNITHDGIVVGTDGRDVRVMIVQVSACSGCHARGACAASDSKEKIIVADSQGATYEIGEKVTLIGSNSMAWSALFIAFIIPMVLALGLLFATVGPLGEAGACLGCLGFLALYYFVLFLLRDRLRTRFVFTLRRAHAEV